MTQEGLSSVCAKIEPANSKKTEILEINVLQKFTSYALFTKIFERYKVFSRKRIQNQKTGDERQKCTERVDTFWFCKAARS